MNDTSVIFVFSTKTRCLEADHGPQGEREGVQEKGGVIVKADQGQGHQGADQEIVTGQGHLVTDTGKEKVEIHQTDASPQNMTSIKSNHQWSIILLTTRCMK